MTKIDNGGPAFPYEDTKHNFGGCDVFSGLTKREWFAGMALQGLINIEHCRDEGEKGMTMVAIDAYSFADAMIEEGKE